MLGGSSLKKTAENLLFNKSLPLSSYKKSTFTLNGKSSVAEVMQTAIGQGNTLVSPMHMALITSAIANGGELMKPYLIDSVVSSDGETVKTTEPESYKRLMTTNEANILGKLMKGVVENGTCLLYTSIIAMLVNNAFKMTVIENVRYRIEKRRD